MADKLFSKDHAWVEKGTDRVVRVGITRFAREELGEIVYIELPGLNTETVRDKGVCAFDSLKSSSEVYTPVSGVILSVNGALESDLGPLNNDPEGDGWLFTVRLSKPDELEDLMDEAAYAAFVRG